MSHPSNKRDRFERGTLKAVSVFDVYYADFGTPLTMPRHFGVLRKTRKHCSNPRCCGNPRRERGVIRKTMQERRAQDVEEVDVQS